MNFEFEGEKLVETQQKQEIMKVILLATIAIALLFGNFEPRQPKIELSSIIPCDRQKCYDEASACGAENTDSLTIDLTCFTNECDNISENGQTYFVNRQISPCQA